MMEEVGVRREVVARSLEALAVEMDRLKRAAFSAGLRALPGSVSEDDDPELIAYDEERRKVHAARRDTLHAVRQQLEGIGQALAQDGAAWSAERDMYDHLLSRASAIPAIVPAPTLPTTAPAPIATSLPLLSATISHYLAQKREADVSERHVDGLSRRFRAFMEHVGDKPLNEYRASDLQSFVSTLARVPANWAKEAAIKDVSARAAAEWNAARRHPLPMMAEGTINLGYARPIRTWFGWLALEHNVSNPFDGLRLKVPKSAKASVRRKPLTVAELNQWFAYAAHDRRPDDRWLPLLGFLTGARIAELVFAQGRDLRPFGDSWALDLMSPLVDKKTRRETRRPLKNAGSARLVALHSALVDAGFVAWARKTPPDGWLFPALHADVLRPSDAASKRQNGRMEKAGVHQPIVKVFHSLRHSANDWLKRGVGLPDALVRRQMGHTAEDSAEAYGDDPLLPDEIARIAAAPLPEGLDISPYLQAFSPRLPGKAGRPRKT
uniref:Tyr recombinase domain-containing protein n=1 Tax=Bosea sp. NBC_00436 TaxID=2969620 RepID=A0A9E8CMJ2_9HYPH